MAKIKASLAEISTEFKLVDPGLWEFEVVSIQEVEDGDELQAYRINSKVVAPGDEQDGRTLSDYINLRTKEGDWSEPGLANLKRYFEVIYGIDEVSGPLVNGKRGGGWSDEDFDTDLLVGKRWRGQVAIRSYTPKGQTEPRQVNAVKQMESVD